MPRRSVLARRSASEWGVRTLIAVCVATAGYASVSRTLAYTMRGTDPARAHMLAPGDGRITAVLSQQLSDADATPADRNRAGRLARQALRQDPTTVAAVATLGIDAQARDDTVRARRLFGYAETLSRRDLRTQIWGIEDAVGRGDLSGALRHYDIALRTERNASTLLFPVLSSAIAEPPVRAALIRTLARNPSWGAHFINHAATEGSDPRATAQLFAALRRVRVAVPDGSRAALVDRLIAGNFLDDAWSVHVSAHPGADRRTSRDPNFRSDTATASRLDWAPAGDGGISTSIQRGDDDAGVFTFAAPASVGGLLLQQWQLLPPGAYRLDGRSAGIEQSVGARPYWALGCGDGRELGRVALANSAQTGGAFAGRFDVPAGCPIQRLSLVTPPSEAVGGQSGEILSVRLRPLR